MILNDRQMTASEGALKDLRDALKELEGGASLRPDINVLFLKAQARAVQARIYEISEEIERYKELKSGQVKSVKIERLSDVGAALVEARIAAGISQRELAERVGIKEQQIQRYEADCYRAAKLERIQEVLEALQSGSEIIIRMPKSSEPLSSPLYESYPYQEMYKRGWFKEIGTKVPMPFVASQYISHNLPTSGAQALHRMKVRSEGQFSPEAMLAWKARVLELANNLEEDLPPYSAMQEFDFKKLVKLSAMNDGICQAVSFVRSSGVALVFEKHLPKTHLDGAAMLSATGRPVIGMTIRHDREDNFWFVLMHELAHIKLHRTNGLKSGFFDDYSAVSESIIEKEADNFALNALIPNEVWSRSSVRFATKVESIKAFAAKLNISPAIVAGRIRSEKQDWRKFTKLVNSVSVRKILVEMGELDE